MRGLQKNFAGRGHTTYIHTTYGRTSGLTERIGLGADSLKKKKKKKGKLGNKAFFVISANPAHTKRFVFSRTHDFVHLNHIFYFIMITIPIPRPTNI